MFGYAKERRIMMDGIGEVGVGKGEMDDSRTNCSGGRLHVLMY